MGVQPLVAQPLKNVGPPKIPGEIGMPWGNTNFGKFVASVPLSWDIGGGGGCWSLPVGGVALPLLIVSLFCVTELLRAASICAAADAIVGMTAGYCQTDGDLIPV